MPQALTSFAITQPGFYGINIQDSPVDMNPAFALEATNCIIDESGRIAARKGHVRATSANAELASGNVTCIGEVIEASGAKTMLCTGNGYLFKYSSGTLTTLTYGGGGVAPTISANNWQFASVNGIGVFAQRGYDPLIYDPSLSVTQFRRLNEKPGSAGTVQQANTLMSAFGRLWLADISTNKQTVWFSDLLQPHVWTGGTSGSIDVSKVWPAGDDEIVSLGSHNGFLYIFGKRQILVYANPGIIANTILEDTVTGIGCVARDSVQNTGSDIIFLSSTGIRSLSRTIQEKSQPMNELSKNIRDWLNIRITSENMDNVKSCYSDINSFYLLTLPATNEVICTDTRIMLENGSYRVTLWQNAPKAIYQASTRKLYIGKAGYVGEYTGYLDDGASFRMTYYTPWLDIGQRIAISILKRIKSILTTSLSQNVIYKWAYDFIPSYRTMTITTPSGSASSEWGTFEWGLGEWGPNVNTNVINIPPSGSGRYVQSAIEIIVAGNKTIIHSVELFGKEGKI